MILMKKLINDEEGQALAEYGLIVMFIAVLLVGTLIGFGDKLGSMYTNIASRL